jgi:hypothetical protein
LIFVITASSGFFFKNKDQNQRTAGYGYLKRIRIKEPLVPGISNPSKNCRVS